MSHLVLRRAVAADAAFLLALANDPATRAASFGRDAIAPAAHVAWLTAVLGDPDRRLWIGEVDGTAVGQVRIDRVADGSGVVSIALAPTDRSRGLGRELLAAALAAGPEELEIVRARAVVLTENEPSRRLFDDAGFRVVGDATPPGGPAADLLERDLAGR